MFPSHSFFLWLYAVVQWAKFTPCFAETVHNITSAFAVPNQQTNGSRQLDSPRCGVPKIDGSDPFGLQAQFHTTPAPTTSSITLASAGARVGPLDTQNTSAESLLTNVPGTGQSNDVFFAALGPILESDSVISSLNGPAVGEGKRHVVPRVLKREVAVERTDGSLHVAQPNQLCWQVQISTQIRLSTSRFGSASCAGAIIGPSTILTAAHCVLNPVSSTPSMGQQVFSPDDTIVHIGGSTADSCDADGSSKSFAASKITKHSDYNAVLGDNDIALIRLAKPIDLGSASSACLLCLQNKMPNIGENCLVSGFGDELTVGNHSLFPLSWTVLKTRQSSLTTSACGFNVDDVTGKTTDLNLFLCAGGTKGEKSCQGDSGAPLVCYNSVADTHYIAGISAFGPPCGVNIGAMYTNVAKYLPWIVENSGGDVSIS